LIDTDQGLVKSDTPTIPAGAGVSRPLSATPGLESPSAAGSAAGGSGPKGGACVVDELVASPAVGPAAEGDAAVAVEVAPSGGGAAAADGVGVSDGGEGACCTFHGRRTATSQGIEGKGGSATPVAQAEKGEARGGGDRGAASQGVKE
jgi:hypothetical protein